MVKRFKYRENELADILDFATETLLAGGEVCGFDAEGLIESHCEDELEEQDWAAFKAKMSNKDNIDETRTFLHDTIETLQDNEIIDLHEYDYNQQYGAYEDYCCGVVEDQALGLL